MGNVRVFRSVEFGDVRTVLLDGEYWFVGVDIANKLGYSNSYGALNKHVDEEDKRLVQNSQIGSFVQETLKVPTRGMILINESGVYSLMLRSKLPSAKKFKRWITSGILPELRKTGVYKIEPPKESYCSNDGDDEKLILAKANMILEKMLSEKTSQFAEQERVIEEKQKIIEEKDKVLTEKEMFINQIARSKNSIKVRDLAQLCCKNGINIGQNRLFEQLRIWGILCRTDNSPYQRYLDMGLFEIVEFPVETTRGVEMKRSIRITGKGQEYIVVKLLKERFNERLAL